MLKTAVFDPLKSSRVETALPKPKLISSGVGPALRQPLSSGQNGRAAITHSIGLRAAWAGTVVGSPPSTRQASEARS